jgi:uncharacterized membrane protein
MKPDVKTLFVTNLLYGVIALIPIAIVVFVVVEALRLLGEIAKPLALHSRFAAAAVVIAGVVGLVVLCFLLGSLVRTRLGSTTFDTIERRFLNRLPIYEPLANLLRGFARKSEGYQPALVALLGPGTGVFCLMMEDNGDGTVTVFVPSAPTMAVGMVHVVDKDRITVLKASLSDVSTCISQWGVGSRKLLVRP